MRMIFAAVLMFLASAGLVRAETSLPSAADQDEIRGVISEQIDAFRRDDGAAAFAFASPQIQTLFGDPERFMVMVRKGYPSVYRPRSVEFQPMRVNGGRLVQPVLVIGPDGVPVMALYVMQQQPDGLWRIDGCTIAVLSDKAV